MMMARRMTTTARKGEQLLTVKQAADRLNASASLVYDLVGARKLRACRIGNGRGRIRIPESAIDEYLARDGGRQAGLRGPDAAASAGGRLDALAGDPVTARTVASRR